MNFPFWLDQKEFRLNLEEKEKGIFQVSLGQKRFNVSVEFISASELLLNMDGKVYNIIVNSDSSSHSVFVGGKFFKIEKKSGLKILNEKRGKLGRRDIKTSMPGRIVRVLAQEGEEVGEGQSILVLEAMKMQNEIKSPQSGRITKIGFRAGDYVETGSVLFSVE